MPRCWPLIAFASVLCGQAVEGPTFEAASLKKLDSSARSLKPLTGGPGTPTPTRATMRLGLTELMRKAFGRTTSEFANIGKLPMDFFDFEAVLPEGTSLTDYRTMLRNLLIERFHLRFHTETHDLKHYEIEVSAGGPKMKLSNNTTASTPAKFTMVGGYVTWPQGVNSGFSGNGPRWSFQQVNITVEDFARHLRDEWLDAPIDDKTGLVGKYDFRLRFTAAPNQESEASEPDLATAMREQLGLILREVKSPAEVIVIDSIDREPTPN